MRFQENQIKNRGGEENIQEQQMHDGPNPQGQDEFGELEESKMQNPPAQESTQESRAIGQGSEQYQENNINRHQLKSTGSVMMFL